MKIIATWSVRPGVLNEAVQRFLAGKGQPGQGLTLLGRWHKTDCSGGFSLFETENPATLYTLAAGWADVLEMQDAVVLEDVEAGPILSKAFGK
jgi:hypothetical protein